MSSPLPWILALRRLLLDILACALAYCVVVILPALSLGARLPLLNSSNVFRDVAIFCLVAFAILVKSRVYRMIWRFVSFRDMLQLTKAVTLIVSLFFIIQLVLNREPHGVDALWLPATLWLTALTFTVAPRVLVRALSESHAAFRNRPVARNKEMVSTLLAGDVGRAEVFIREAIRNPNSEYQPAGVFCDDPKLYGGHIHGVPVLGPVTEIVHAVANLRKRGVNPQMLVLTCTQPAPGEVERLLHMVSGLSLKVGHMPSLNPMKEDSAPVRPVVISDLLGRPEIVLDNTQLETMISGRNVLITGAGGSIGSELSRQIAALRPSNVVLADFCEFNLYSIEMEFKEKFPNVPYCTALVDVRDAALVLQWVRRFRPDIVFHAAALKHVPLLEDHPVEAVKTNVLGTVNVADACYTCGVPLMVTISTDKAVNPFNVMGATKRLAEAYCQGLDQGHAAPSNTRFVTVRFGNVLGSAGSVVPLFLRQIEEGGPVTVTHPEITRYFMTIPEAVSLVLQASAQGKIDQSDRGSIYVLNMGQPVRIMDLAEQMIRLSGKRPGTDIEIKVIGLRPGEKLYEEVVHAEEFVSETRNKSVFKVTPRVTDLRILQQQIQELRQAASASDVERVPRLLTIAVPEYGEAIRAVRTRKQQHPA